jgi:hypothetical protein
LLVTSGVYPRRKHLKGPSIGLAPALPSNSKTRLERVSKGKPSSLLDLVISDEEKRFYNIDTCGLYYKLMLIINDESRVINKLEASLTDYARVIIHNCHMFIVQATGGQSFKTTYFFVTDPVGK